MLRGILKNGEFLTRAKRGDGNSLICPESTPFDEVFSFAYKFGLEWNGENLRGGVKQFSSKGV